jgi:hypothetical protein
MSPPRVVLFDIGGVVVGSPLVGINAYEAQHGLPHDYLNVAITARGRQGAFQRFERSELDLHSFYARFGQELSEAEAGNEAYRQFCRRRGVGAWRTSARRRGKWAEGRRRHTTAAAGAED